MSISITIGGTVISFPSSGEAPNWSPAVIEFAQAVEQALSATAGQFDVPPQVQVIDSSNPGTNVNISGLSFPTSDVRAAFIRYAVYRTTSTNTAYEAGNLMVVYNPNGSSSNKWEIVRDYVGDGQITFAISDVGQVSFSTTTMSGISHVGKITYTAQALQNS